MNSNFLPGVKRAVFASVTIVMALMSMPGTQALAGRSAAFVLIRPADASSIRARGMRAVIRRR